MTDDTLDEVERVFGLLSEQFGAGSGGVPADVIDSGGDLLVTVDLPGFEPADVDVTLTDDRTVRVTGTRTTEEGDGRYVTRERTRSVERTVRLPDPVIADEATAAFDAGVLTVTLPKQAPDDEGTQVPVN